MNYTDKEINDFLELAQEVGITKAKRELNYPSSWGTAQRWAKLRGIEVAVDDLKAKAAETREFYKDEEIKVLAQEGFNRVADELMNNQHLSPDDQKKLAEAGVKWYNVWANVQGKATNINENRQADPMDTHLMELLNAEKAKHLLKDKEDVTESLSD